MVTNIKSVEKEAFKTLCDQFIKGKVSFLKKSYEISFDFFKEGALIAAILFKNDEDARIFEKDLKEVKFGVLFMNLGKSH